MSKSALIVTSLLVPATLLLAVTSQADWSVGALVTAPAEVVEAPTRSQLVDSSPLEMQRAPAASGGRTVTMNLDTGEVSVAWRGTGESQIPVRLPDPGQLRLPDDERAVVGSEDHEPVSAASTASYPYRTAVKLFVQFDSGGGSCTGTLIGPHHVLTAGHCIYDASGGTGWATSVEAAPGYHQGNRPFGTAHATRLSTYIGWIENGDFAYDIGVVELDRNIGDFVGWLGFEYWSDPAAYEGMNLNMNHYPAAYFADGQTLYHGYDEVTIADALQLQHELDTAPGSSGGGLYRYTDDGSRFIDAINSWEYTNGSANGGPHLTQIRFDNLVDHLDNDPTPVDRADLFDGGDGQASIVGQELHLAITVNNQGTAPAEDLEIGVHLSIDPGLDASDPLVATLVVEELEPFTHASGELALPIPAGIPSGSYRVLWVIDPTDAVDEYDESDNLTVASVPVYLERDFDGDGVDAQEYGGEDCDDDDGGVYPGAEETCDGVDEDCDGDTDEGIDEDDDGYEGCYEDCDDGDDSVHPGADDEPENGIDEDCDGQDAEEPDSTWRASSGDGTTGRARRASCETSGAGEAPMAGLLLVTGLFLRRRSQRLRPARS